MEPEKARESVARARAERQAGNPIAYGYRPEVVGEVPGVNPRHAAPDSCVRAHYDRAEGTGQRTQDRLTLWIYRSKLPKEPRKNC